MTITGVCLAWRTLGFPRQMHGRGGVVQEGFALAAICGYLAENSSRSWMNICRYMTDAQSSAPLSLSLCKV
jgi:hypothetical protein